MAMLSHIARFVAASCPESLDQSACEYALSNAKVSPKPISTSINQIKSNRQ